MRTGSTRRGKCLIRAAGSRKPLSILQGMLSPGELQVPGRGAAGDDTTAPHGGGGPPAKGVQSREWEFDDHGLSGFGVPIRHIGKSRKSVGKEKHNGERHERRDIPSSHRKAPGADDETGLLLYTPAIWQSAHTAESAFRPTADCVRSILCQGRHAGQETAASTGDRPADP